MILPELDVEKVRRFCRKKVPDTLADEVRLEVTTRGKSFSIHERRPVWRGAPGEWTSMSIAQLRSEGNGEWTLYFGDRTGTWVICTSTSTRSSRSTYSSTSLRRTPPSSSGADAARSRPLKLAPLPTPTAPTTRTRRREPK